jgi:shikimate kinase
MSNEGSSKRGNNYVLIGLPGCGKSTLGKRAAEELGLDFYDTDKLVVKALEGDSTSFLTLLHGYTREETRVLWELSETARRSVIATGASVVSFDYNILILRRLGHIFFIDRDPQILSASSKSRYVVKINDEEPINLAAMNVKSHLDLNYADIADSTVVNNGDENEGLANLVAAIKGLERGEQS